MCSGVSVQEGGRQVEVGCIYSLQPRNRLLRAPVEIKTPTAIFGKKKPNRWSRL